MYMHQTSIRSLLHTQDHELEDLPCTQFRIHPDAMKMTVH